MNEVSIIINGIRYDAVSGEKCSDCDLYKLCGEMNYYDQHGSEWHEPFASVCGYLVNNLIFKQSDKKFER